MNLSPNDERYGEGEGKEVLPSDPIPSSICGQHFRHHGFLGLHQPLMPVAAHSFTAMKVTLPPRERDPLEGLLYDPMGGTGSELGRGLECGIRVSKTPPVKVGNTGAIPKRLKEKKKTKETATEPMEDS